MELGWRAVGGAQQGEAPAVAPRLPDPREAGVEAAVPRRVPLVHLEVVGADQDVGVAVAAAPQAREVAEKGVAVLV